MIKEETLTWIQKETYVCEECDLKFRNKLSWKEHKKEHEIHKREK